MHSAQYLWITSYYARRESSGEQAAMGRNWRPLAYFGVLIVGGIALFVPGPWLASRVFHHDFSLSFLIFTSLVNIHHFILDGVVWKLRDGRIAALLLNSKERVADAVAGASGGFVSACRWAAGNSVLAFRLRVTAAVLLLCWGTLDQARHYLALQSNDLADLRRAAALDSFDSQLQARLARRQLEEGNTQEAEAAWRRSIEANPADPAPRQALLKFLLEQKRYDDAFALDEVSLKYAPKDANLLVDHRLLALRRGYADQALSDWERALKTDPNQSLAHLYLAHELDHEGKTQSAIPHYRRYLEEVAEQPGQRPSPDVLVGIVLRLAECQLRSSQHEAAAKSYDLAQKLAQQTGQAKLESIADVNQAQLQGTVGNVTEALRLYQHALELDEVTNDKAASSVDWFAYGQFLEQSGFPAKMVYACMLKSESIARVLSKADVLVPVTAKRQQLEKRLGAEAASVRRNLDPVLQDALHVQR